MFAQIDYLVILSGVILFVMVTIALANIMIQSNKRTHQAAIKRIELEANLGDAKRAEVIASLAGGMAFHVNNIMFNLSDYSMELESEGRGPRFKALQEAISSEIVNARIITDRLYLVTHPSEQILKSISFIELMRSLKGWIESSVPTSIKIQTESTQDRCAIMGNMSLLQQALEGILLNAIEAMAGGGTLSLSLKNEALDKKAISVDSHQESGAIHLILTISDTGCGMNEDALIAAFEPFSTTKGGPDRLGLGLSLAYGVIQLHKGKLKLHSDEMRGTAAELIFPIASEIEPAEIESRNAFEGYPSHGSVEANEIQPAIGDIPGIA